MTKLQIEYFMAVAEYGSFTNAAKNIYISQPTITQQINALEHELGFRVFVRQPRKVELTPSGQVMLECFARCRDDYEAAFELADKLNTGKSGNLKVGLLSFATLQHVTKDINEYAACKEGVVPQILSGGLSKLRTYLLSGKIDIAFLYDDSIYDIPDLVFSPIYKSEYKIILSKNHPLAQKPELKTEDVLNEPFVVCFSGVLDRHKETYKKIGLRNVNLYQVSDFETMYTVVASGFGAAVSDEHIIFLDRDVYRVIDTGVYHSMGAARMKDKTSWLAEDFVQFTGRCGVSPQIGGRLHCG